MEETLHIKPSIVLIVADIFLFAFLSAHVNSKYIPGEVLEITNVLFVTSNADTGAGTLRQALLDASDGDTILFSPATFPPSSPATIRLASSLPTITQNNLTIDASNAGVILDGNAVGNKISGLNLQANGVKVRGLRIVNFDGCGIEVRGQNNTIGGDRMIGIGPFGQGNLLGGNGHSGVCMFDGAVSNIVRGNLIGVDATGMNAWGNQGDGVQINGGYHNLVEENVISSQKGDGIRICCSTQSAHNTIRNNMIGVGRDGQTPIPCFDKGVAIADGANHNTIGPGNVIAYTAGSYGVSVAGGLSPANSILGNSIYGNEGVGILLWNENLDLVRPPAITTFDLAQGTVSGLACSGCLVQIYSDKDNEGRVFEGQATAGVTGAFSFAKGTPLTGPHLTATATDSPGTTSAFSIPTVGSRSVPLQTGNLHPYSRLATLSANQLPDNRIGFSVQDQTWVDCGMFDTTVLNRMGVKRVHGQMNEGDPALVNWQTDEYQIHENFDQMITGLKQNGIQMTYNLIFWDKEHYRQTGQIPPVRFQTEEEIQRWLDFVRHMVRSFGNRVDYWELWNEPHCHGSSFQCFPVATYIEVGIRVIQVIRQEDPGAKIVVPSYHGWDPPELYQEYLYPILESELMPLVDVIAWHPFIVHLDPKECGGEFFERYWQTVFPEIRSIATAHGFHGEYRVDELRFQVRTPSTTTPCAVEDRTAGKYYAREIIHHLGENVAAGIIMNGDTQGWMVVQNLSTLMAGAQAVTSAVEVTSPSSVVSYTFTLPSGDRLVAIWNDVDIADEDTAISVTLRLPASAEDTAYGIDILNGVQQRLVATLEGEDLVVRDLLVKDYPLLVHLAPLRKLYLPIVTRK